MRSALLATLALVAYFPFCNSSSNRGSYAKCRTLPGDSDFPSQTQWDQLNTQIGGRLLTVVPSAKFCHSLPSGNCMENEWESTTFRGTIPGAMGNYNWEQDYLSDPPSLCLQNGTTCGQGNVPVFAVNASFASDIQAGVKFATKHNLKVSIKASGHDFLGRSTAKGSLLLWTHYLRNISFSDSFIVGGEDVGSVMTAGSGLPLNLLYETAKEHNKMFVGGFAATVVASGGYIQGGGHSAFSPYLGLAVDNVIQFEVVTADGKLVTANKAEHSDFFWALRGGGAGSWGVIVSTTFKTFPAFNATMHQAIYAVLTNETTLSIVSAHLKHANDIDDLRAGQYFYIYPNLPISAGVTANIVLIMTMFPNASSETANAVMQPLIDEVEELNVTRIILNSTTAIANDLVFTPDDTLGGNTALGSRLIPAEVFKQNSSGILGAYEAFLKDSRITSIMQNNIAGGKVSENKNISVSVTQKWRTAKSHFIVSTGWSDNASIDEIEATKDAMTHEWVPRLAELTGEKDGGGAYSNEADAREPNFQVTFFNGGKNYAKLKKIKSKYDACDLFIVTRGVGSERWDDAGLCRL